MWRMPFSRGCILSQRRHGGFLTYVSKGQGWGVLPECFGGNLRLMTRLLRVGTAALPAACSVINNVFIGPKDDILD